MISGETKIYNGLEIDGVGGQSGAGINYHFCTTCGSTLFWTVTGQPTFIGIGVGSFVDPNFPVPTMELYTPFRHHWVPPVPTADQYETLY